MPSISGVSSRTSGISVADGSRFGLDVAYSFDGPVLLGTAECLGIRFELGIQSRQEAKVGLLLFWERTEILSLELSQLGILLVQLPLCFLQLLGEERSRPERLLFAFL